ncbi:hypothetical protein LSH36_958g00101 [Paralvinella palmiformis]|uniref:C3H1-type domain-containing protein n=1 Tax=Paralvinella palmiformis TaxID=53620 RepID=A0AAD9MR59_9ANNE|nr:hypothetical protein LSH36_958g00101 [Paralvinella palmiformis]
MVRSVPVDYAQSFPSLSQQQPDTSPAKKTKRHPNLGKESEQKQTGEQSIRPESSPKSTSERLERKSDKKNSAQDEAIDDEDDDSDDITDDNPLSSGRFHSLQNLANIGAPRRNVKKGKTPRKDNKRKTATNSGRKGSSQKSVGSGGARPKERHNTLKGYQHPKQQQQLPQKHQYQPNHQFQERQPQHKWSHTNIEPQQQQQELQLKHLQQQWQQEQHQNHLQQQFVNDPQSQQQRRHKQHVEWPQLHTQQQLIVQKVKEDEHARQDTQQHQQQRLGCEDAQKPDIRQICGLCWKNGQTYSWSTTRLGYCAAPRSCHQWERERIYVVMPEKRVIRQPPNVSKFKLCKNVKTRGECIYGRCSFAHSEAELRVWQWLKEHNVNLKSIAKNCDLPATRIPPKSTTKCLAPNQPLLGVVLPETYSCQFCGVGCNSRVQLEIHCASKKHKENIDSDREQQWNYRHPPLDRRVEDYRLCPRLSSRTCNWSDCPQEYNMCPNAHSEEELDEWKKRRRHKWEKRRQAKSSNLYSYMDNLQEEIKTSECETSVLADSVVGIAIECDKDLTQLTEDKGGTTTWSFQVKADDLKLQRVALVYSKGRSYFHLETDQAKQDADCQLLSEDDFEQSTGIYLFRVHFKAEVFGSFAQTVVFDFGQRPVIARQLYIDIASKKQIQTIKKNRKSLDFYRWTEANSTIIGFPRMISVESGEEGLLKKYQPPRSIDAIITYDMLSSPLSRENYVHKMHKLIELEDLKRSQIISSYCSASTLHTVKYIDGDCFVNAPEGQMFAWLDLPETLSKDTPAGRLIIMAVSTVLLREKNTERVVYEGLILTREYFNFEGRTEDKLYICLSKSCIDAWKLSPDTEREIEMQFVFNRLTFCKWHLILDELDSLDILYPKVNRIQSLGTIDYEVQESILNSGKVGNLPIIVYGPFGTGKTETLALAAKLLAKDKREESRILICTHSNSAADLYIERYFDPFVKDTSLRVLRLYQTDRRLNTISDVIRPYCNLSQDQRHLVIPSADVIAQKRIIVSTCSAAFSLAKMKRLKGHFTHIIIDEAAQALQCEILIPLALATHQTCVVLAGDHKQMRQEVFSSVARKEHLDRTMIEHYIDYYVRLRTLQSCHMLSINYRTTEEILKFISSVFYGGSESIIAATKWEDKPMGFSCLNFFMAHGQEKYDSERTSWYNEAEVDEIVTRVQELYEKCPWGTCTESDIGIVATERAQVDAIRVALRRCHLRNVTVVVPMAVQGQEFKAVFISTVRTKRCNSEQAGNLDLGFLTNTNLLNTVLTRTKFYVGVVGNPETLCTTGTCARIWVKYIQHCQKNGSITPPFDIQEIRALNEPTSELPFDTSLNSQIAECDEDMEVDQILPQLIRETQKILPDEVKMFDIRKERSPFRMDNITIKEKCGIAFPEYKERSKVTVNKKRKLFCADDCGEEFNSQSSGTDSEDELAVEGGQADYSPDDLRSLIQRNPQKYKRCTLIFTSAVNIRAEVLDKDDDVQQLAISSRRRCGQALNNDEVCVEVKCLDDEDRIFTSSTKDTDEPQMMQGEVVGILRRYISLRYRRFVCTVDEPNRGLLIPINITLPRMRYVTNRERIKRKPNNKIPLYEFSKSRQIVFVGYEDVTEDNGEKKLFVARFLKWERQFRNPLCVVIGVLPLGITLDKGLHILDIEYCLRKSFPATVRDSVKEIKHHLVEKTDKDRSDKRDLNTFTIDPGDSKDLDDALSLEKLSNNHFRVGVHISDVSYYVQRNSEIDKEALSRGNTFYPTGKDPIPMLPEYLSTNVCSLISDEDRKTVSLFIEINNEAECVRSDISRCTIRSRKRLTYKEAEAILENETISGSNTPDEVIQSIQSLNKIASMWRKKRLGDESHFHCLDSDSEDTPKAHHLVQEMMIYANRLVAEKLLDYYPDCCPLRSQLAPAEEELEKWKRNFSNIASNTFVLKQPFLPKFHVCHCVTDCTCIQDKQKVERNDVAINLPIWNNVMTSLTREAGDRSRFSIANPDILPEASTALSMLYHIRKPSSYICSGDYSLNMQYHDTLQAKAYTHFTSPIRRYIDIVVHRLIVAMLRNEPCPYTKETISEICRQCSDKTRTARAYEVESKVLYQAIQLQTNPQIVHSVVETLSPTELQLSHLGYKSLRSVERRVKVRYLKVCEEPFFDDRQQMILRWKERIYDNAFQDSPDSKRRPQIQCLNPHRFVASVPESHWKKLLVSVRSQQLKNIMEACLEVNVELKKEKTKKYIDDVNSEQMEMQHANQLCNFSLELSRASIIRIQLTACTRNGLLTPSVQLLSLTPTLDLCIEHQSDPVLCFVDVNNRSLVLQYYSTLDQYVAGWQHLVAIEAVKASINDRNSVTIHNVGITWTKYNSDMVATFQLKSSFCEARSILTGSTSKDNAGDDDNESICKVCNNANDNEDASLDYICVRYSNIDRNLARNVNSEGCYAIEDKPTWVGHCLSTDVELDKKAEGIQVKMKLFQSREHIPNSVTFCKSQATIEIIPQFYPSRRENEALNHMRNNEMELLEAIALNKIVPPFDKSHTENISQLTAEIVPHLPKPNRAQTEAIASALRNKFTLIQGPPGTGKTVTGVRLAYLLTRLNKTRSNKGDVRPQLLICGPSNDSVDVITGYLSRMGHDCPLIVRIYGTTIERKEFPLPWDNFVTTKLSQYVRGTELTKYALHHMIRDPRECRFAEKIRNYDARIRNQTEEKQPMSSEDKTKYKKLIFDAKCAVIKRKELIIDENGMCTEPQSMVPIVSAEPEQVILIGDHKQLQPIITDDRARRLGLGVSLFERYAKQAHMLVTQYRMHEAIAAFPSQHFYNNRLECGSEVQKAPSNLRGYWPGGINRPICFVHIVGKEETLTVRTPEGSENSKSNMEEVVAAVRIAFNLVNNRNVRAKDILILSQYRAQCDKIKQELSKRYLSIKVSTVVAAQGRESDVVILSTVRSMPKAHIEGNPSQSWMQRHLGFITDQHQINVALTRAKKGLIVIGNKNLLRIQPMWNMFFHHYEENKAVTTFNLFIKNAHGSGNWK